MCAKCSSLGAILGHLGTGQCVPSLREGIGREIPLWPQVRYSGLLPASSFLPTCLKAASTLHWPHTGDGEETYGGYVTWGTMWSPLWTRGGEILNKQLPAIHVAKKIIDTSLCTRSTVMSILLPCCLCLCVCDICL